MEKIRVRILIVLLAAGTMALYWPARHFDFLLYDDAYFVANPGVLAGLSWHTFTWAMTDIVFKDWHPVAVLSFLLTHQMFGFNSGAEHLVNVEFHAANAVLLFLVLLRLTGATWPSVVVAAIFAWHPLRVESVCWIAERKDVLFVFFMLLSLLCYAEYARRAAGASSTAGGSVRPCWYPWTLCYNCALIFFILSFLSKGMVATMPFLLLLLDFWPLQRFRRTTVLSLILEKAPFFALTFFFSALTFWIHARYGDTLPLGEFSLSWRLENAVWSYLMYLGQLFWPMNLAPIYPYPASYDLVQIVLAGLLLLAISVLCLLELSRRPYLAVGWFWYLGMMFPVIGLVQFGQSPMGDRFTYVPLIGPVISLVWLAWEWAGEHFLKRCLAATGAVVALIVWVNLTRAQMMYWQDTVILFRHTIAVTSENALAHYPLAVGLDVGGLSRQAAVQYRVAIAEDPGYQLKWEYFRMGGVLVRLGQYHEGNKDLEKSIRLDPNFTDGINGLARLLATCPEADIRDGPRAIRLAQQICETKHYQNATYLGTLAAAYAETGEYDKAIAAAQKAIEVARDDGQMDWAKLNEERLKLYEAHQPYHGISDDQY